MKKCLMQSFFSHSPNILYIFLLLILGILFEIHSLNTSQKLFHYYWVICHTILVNDAEDIYSSSSNSRYYIPPIYIDKVLLKLSNRKKDSDKKLLIQQKIRFTISSHLYWQNVVQTKQQKKVKILIYCKSNLLIKKYTI